MASSPSALKCVVCGYVHRGDNAPEVCPICGAPTEEFEPFQEAPAPSASTAGQWRCLICGYVHDGTEAPDACPVCGAGTDEFEACGETAAPEGHSNDSRRIVIIGGGIAGVSAAESARQALPKAEILLLGEEPVLPYYRLNLTRRIAGEIGEEALSIHPQSWYDEKNIHLRTGAKVHSLDPEQHSITTEDNERIPYDKLILACGAHPFIPPIPGADLPGVGAVRTLEDVRELLDRVEMNTPVVCIGGGILGLETAGALAKRGATITLLEGFDYLLPRQLNRDAAGILAESARAMGITIRPKSATKAILDDGAMKTVLLEDDTRLSASLITITTGVRANTHLARRAGLSVNQGIVVDAHMATSHPNIYAAGDCAEYGGAVAGLWEPAQYQGAIAGHNAAGVSAEFGGIPRMNTLKVLGIKMFSMGVIQPDDGSYKEIVETGEGRYRRFLFRDGFLAGAILVGDTALAAAATRAAREHTDCSALMAPETTVENVSAFLSRL